MGIGPSTGNGEGFVPRTCPKCGEPRNEWRDGRDFILRCSCDWRRGALERLRNTVSQAFWKTEGKPAKSLADWDPPIFKDDGTCKFQALIDIQRVGVIRKMESFCFRERREGKSVNYALGDSIEQGKNLFIRGPAGSGRGLLMATIKMLAAGKDIPATPNPGEWTTFKSDLLISESFRAEGEAARIAVSEKYVEVPLLALENIRAEPELSHETREGFRRKWRGALSADSVFARRQARAGSVVLTSFDFAGEIGGAFGDKILEMLVSPSTALMLMFDKGEADSLLEGIGATKTRYDKVAKELSSAGSSSQGVRGRLDKEESLREIEDYMFFEEAFPEIPGTIGMRKAMSPENVSVTSRWPEQAAAAYARFRAIKDTNGIEYRNRLDRACVVAVDACQGMARRMNSREITEVGKMMSAACSSKDKIGRLMREGAEALRRICPHA